MNGKNLDQISAAVGDTLRCTDSKFDWWSVGKEYPVESDHGVPVIWSDDHSSPYVVGDYWTGAEFVVVGETVQVSETTTPKIYTGDELQEMFHKGEFGYGSTFVAAVTNYCWEAGVTYVVEYSDEDGDFEMYDRDGDLTAPFGGKFTIGKLMPAVLSKPVLALPPPAPMTAIAAYSPTLWEDMTREQRGELLLSQSEGKPIQMHCTWVEVWEDLEDPLWIGHNAYRVKPEGLQKAEENLSEALEYLLRDKEALEAAKAEMNRLADVVEMRTELVSQIESGIQAMNEVQ